jgi:hypothetical protein
MKIKVNNRFMSHAILPAIRLEPHLLVPPRRSYPNYTAHLQFLESITESRSFVHNSHRISHMDVPYRLASC